MSPIKWWIVHGTSAPMLQSIALKLLGQPCSSSCCERNWSTYNFIHFMKRNKLTPQIAEDLVYVYNNLRLLSRRSPNYNEGESKMWDIGGDGFDSMDIENAGILEIANLLLMNLNWKPFYLIQKEMLVFSFSITYVCFLIFVKTMFV